VLGRVPAWVVRGVLLPVAFLLLVHALVVDTIHVSGTSMEGTLAPGDFLVVSKLAVTRAALRGETFTPARGQIVVFHLPRNPALTLIKRVMALPGDTVSLADGTPHRVARDSVFVEGDNRAPGASSDSRDWGDLPASEIVGVAVLRVLPFRSAGLVK
jgi:signal peptidase I